MAEDDFFNVQDWYEQNKYSVPKELHPIFEHNHMKFIFKWKEVEHRLVPDIYEYLTHYYPFMQRADKAKKEEIEHAIVLVVFRLCERVWKTMKDCFGKRTVEEVYKDHVLVIDATLGYFKFTDLENSLRLIAEDMPEPRFSHIVEEEQTAMKERAKEGIARHKRFIDVVQPTVLEVFPNLMDLEGDWWKVYEYLYAVTYNDIYDDMNSIEHKFEQQEQAK